MSRNILLAAFLSLLVPSLSLAAPQEHTQAKAPDAPQRAAQPTNEADAPPKIAPIIGAGGPHEVHHEAPHHGALVPIGKSDAHLEFVLEPKTGLLTCYALDGEAKEPLRLRQTMLFVNIDAAGDKFPIVLFAPKDQNVDPAVPRGGSMFQASHRHLEGVTSFEGDIGEVKVGRQAYRLVKFSYPEGTEPAEAPTP